MGEICLQLFAAALYLADAGLQLFACAVKDRLLLRRITKCFLMPLLALCYFEFAGSVSALVLLALLGGFVGDVVLLLRPRRWAFAAGIAAFAAGHVFYIVGFLRALPTRPPWYLFAGCFLLCLLGAILLMRYIVKGIPKKLRAPAFVYMLVIGFMASSTILFGLFGATRFGWLASIGGVLFLSSDCTLAIDAFHHPVRFRNVIVMSTYIAAQTLIVAAFALL